MTCSPTSVLSACAATADHWMRQSMASPPHDPHSPGVDDDLWETGPSYTASNRPLTRAASDSAVPTAKIARENSALTLK